MFILRDTQRETEIKGKQGGVERKEDREFEADFKIQAVSTEPDAGVWWGGIKPRNYEITT